MVLLDIRLITVSEYYQMAKTGILDPSEQVELLAGQIVKKSMKGTLHTAAVAPIDNVIRKLLGDLVLIRLQDPIHLDNFSEPEPDIALVIPDPLYYEAHHPTPAEIYLIIEVADTSIKKDTEVKAQIYAQAGIRDYWVLDVLNRQLHVFREPSANGYLSKVILTDGDRISLLNFSETTLGSLPEIEIQVSDILRPL